MLHLLSHKGLALWDVSKQQIHSDRQLGDMLFEARGRILGSLPCRLEKVLVSLSVIQLEGLDPSKVVVVPCPLIVAGLLREGRLENQLVRLVVQVVVEVVPQKTVDENGLTLKIVSQGCSPQTSVESGSA